MNSSQFDKAFQFVSDALEKAQQSYARDYAAFRTVQVSVSALQALPSSEIDLKPALDELQADAAALEKSLQVGDTNVRALAQVQANLLAIRKLYEVPAADTAPAAAPAVAPAAAPAAAPVASAPASAPAADTAAPVASAPAAEPVASAPAADTAPVASAPAAEPVASAPAADTTPVVADAPVADAPGIATVVLTGDAHG